MNIWLKSAGTGAVAALIVFLTGRQMPRTKSHPVYYAEYTIQVRPEKGKVSPLLVKQVLAKRLYAAELSHEIRIISDSLLKVAVKGPEDTAFLSELLTSGGHLQIMEMYISSEAPLQQVFKTAHEVALQQQKESNPVAPPKINRSPMSKEVSDLLDSMDQKSRYGQNTAGLFQFLDNQISYTTSAGHVKSSDTAALMRLLHHPYVKASTPSDLFFIWGDEPGPSSTAYQKKNKKFLLYAVKKLSVSDKALIENNDIADASAIYSYDNRPEVSITFIQAGSRKWALLTRKNIGRPLAIIFDGRLLSAPEVQSEITGGRAVINGNFTT
jgi:hypothetical protein